MLSGQDKYKLAVTEWKEDPNRAEKEADEIIKKYLSDIDDTRHERLLCILHRSASVCLSEKMSGHAKKEGTR